MTALDLVQQDTVLPQMLSACQGKLDESRPWHTILAVRTGPVIVGVRADTAETSAWLESALEPVRAREFDGKVWPNFSVTLGSQSRRESLMLVYHDHEIVGRRRERRALLGDLVELLDEGPRLLQSDRVIVHASAIWGSGGQVLLIPGTLHTNVLMRRSQLEGAGLHVGLSRTQVVDLSSLTVTMGCVDPALAELDSSPAKSSDDQSLRLHTWCVPATGDQIFDLRAPEAMVAVAGMVLNRYVLGMGTTLRGLAGAMREIRVATLPPLSTGALAATIIELVASMG